MTIQLNSRELQVDGLPLLGVKVRKYNVRRGTCGTPFFLNAWCTNLKSANIISQVYSIIAEESDTPTEASKRIEALRSLVERKRGKLSQGEFVIQSATEREYLWECRVAFEDELICELGKQYEQISQIVEV